MANSPTTASTPPHEPGFFQQTQRKFRHWVEDKYYKDPAKRILNAYMLLPTNKGKTASNIAAELMRNGQFIADPKTAINKIIDDIVSKMPAIDPDDDNQHLDLVAAKQIQTLELAAAALKSGHDPDRLISALRVEADEMDRWFRETLPEIHEDIARFKRDGALAKKIMEKSDPANATIYQELQGRYSTIADQFTRCKNIEDVRAANQSVSGFDQWLKAHSAEFGEFNKTAEEADKYLTARVGAIGTEPLRQAIRKADDAAKPKGLPITGNLLDIVAKIEAINKQLNTLKGIESGLAEPTEKGSAAAAAAAAAEGAPRKEEKQLEQRAELKKQLDALALDAKQYQESLQTLAQNDSKVRELFRGIHHVNQAFNATSTTGERISVDTLNTFHQLGYEPPSSIAISGTVSDNDECHIDNGYYIVDPNNPTKLIWKPEPPLTVTDKDGNQKIADNPSVADLKELEKLLKLKHPDKPISLKIFPDPDNPSKSRFELIYADKKDPNKLQIRQEVREDLRRILQRNEELKHVASVTSTPSTAAGDEAAAAKTPDEPGTGIVSIMGKK